MKEDFDNLLYKIKNNTSPEFQDAYINAEKENTKSKYWFWSLAIIIDLLVGIKLFSFTKSLGILGILFLLVPIFIIDIILYAIINACFSKNRKAYSKLFKSNVIKKLLDNFYNNVNFLPNNQMPSRIYDEAKYNEYYNEYSSDDYMEGLLNDKHLIKMAEVHTVDVETTTDSDGNTTTTRTTKFHGLFAKIEMEKSINSELLIRRNHSISKKNRLDMDSQEFEKLFDVSATNQIIGMQLLTHDIMELLVSFKKMTGIEYDVSIYGNTLYLRFHTGSMFEFMSFKKGAFDEKMLKKYYDVLDFTYTLSNMLIDLIEKTEI